MPATLTSREFNQDTARAKREAASGPVFVTDRGKPTHVLLTVAAYEQLAPQKKSILDLLQYPGAAEIELPLPEREIEAARDISFGPD
jgi:PHD/YefM family antitoxin component YafN of YafNO toxin-antitoxin module